MRPTYATSSVPVHSWPNDGEACYLVHRTIPDVSFFLSYPLARDLWAIACLDGRFRLGALDPQVYLRCDAGAYPTGTILCEGSVRVATSFWHIRDIDGDL